MDKGDIIQLKNRKFVVESVKAVHEDHTTFICTWAGRTYCVRTYNTDYQKALDDYKQLKHAGINMAKMCYHDDDAKDECFRAYRKVEDSYEDHSEFLTKGARYAFLFKLKVTDYKGWAKGLKKAGYATDPSYANRLISIIEDYELYKYDREGMSKRETRKWERLIEKKPWLVNPHQVYIANGLAYVVARAGDTFQLLGGEFDISWKKLVSYNDLHKEYTLEEGDIIYLKKKNKKAQKPYDYYIVRSGDSMHSISQKFGIRLKNLYKMNKKDADYVPEVGHKLKLR